MSDDEKKIEKITLLSLLAFAKPKEKISIRDKTVYLYDLSSDALEKLSSILKEKEDCEVRFRKILPHISSLNEINDIKEKREPLPANFIDQLTQAELEQIALKYKNIPSINILSIQKENADDEIIVLKEKESAIHYLDRLLTEKDKRAHSAINRLKKLVENSNKLGAAIDSYSASYKEALRKSQHDRIIETAKLGEDFIKVRHEREEEQKQFQSMSEMTILSVSLLKELSSTTATFLINFNEQSQKTDKLTRKQVLIATWALIATVVFSSGSLLFSASSVVIAYEQEKARRYEQQEEKEQQRWNEMADSDEESIIKPRKKPQH